MRVWEKRDFERMARELAPHDEVLEILGIMARGIVGDMLGCEILGTPLDSGPPRGIINSTRQIESNREFNGKDEG